jgi:hypothetical protein
MCCTTPLLYALGMIDEFELYEATRVLARHGRIREPTRAQVRGRMSHNWLTGFYLVLLI